MDELVLKFHEYLNDNLALQISVSRCRETNKLPLVLREGYDFFETSIYDQRCVLLVPKFPGEITPAIISKHIEQLRKYLHSLPIYLTESMTPFNRRRLIQHKVPFIVPHNQMYLPFLGLDLREHFTGSRKRRIEGLTPSSQAILIWLLYEEGAAQYSVNRLSQIFGYSTMTISRVFNELEALSIVESRKEGRQRVIISPIDKKIWDTRRDYLCSPVRNRKFLSILAPTIEGVRAGLSALAGYTMIAEPRIPVYACTPTEWKRLRADEGVEVLPEAEPGAVEIEIWSYSPHVCARNGLVDPLSLYLSFQDTHDERVESALEKLTGVFPW